MFVYDKAYMAVKNKYILPLTRYSVPYTKLRTLNIKSVLIDKFKSVDDLGNKSYLIYFDNDILLKALLGDIELFYIRSIIQKADVQYIMDKNVSANWNIVTNYYYSFFLASLMLRLCHRGNLFLDKSLKTTFEKLISEVIGERINLDNNLFYEIQIQDSSYVMKLSPAISNTHELVWKKMDELMDELLLLSGPRSDEYLILKSIKNINNKLSNTYPSKLRNKVNYQPLYGLEYLDKKIYPLNSIATSWLKELINFNIEEIIENDNRIANISQAYTEYIYIFCNNLINEYFNMNGFQNGIISKLNENRSKKIVLNELPFAYEI